jgi:hypothetical protein
VIVSLSRQVLVCKGPAGECWFLDEKWSQLPVPGAGGSLYYSSFQIAATN